MPRDSFLSRIVRASRPGPPLLKVSVSPWLARVLVAAGAQSGSSDDSMTVRFGPTEAGLGLPREAQVARAPDDAGVAVITHLPDGTVTIRPRTYGAARLIGEYLRKGTPVVLDVRETNRRDAKSLVDFAAGVIFALNGSFERLGPKFFFLVSGGTPSPRKFQADRDKHVVGPSFGLEPASSPEDYL